jgi:hypothetical protein|tara:strand:- start:162 stop:371 length:210 start_codon:yes stop_codon:yes gene_type:complete
MATKSTNNRELKCKKSIKNKNLASNVVRKNVLKKYVFEKKKKKLFDVVVLVVKKVLDEAIQDFEKFSPI